MPLLAATPGFVYPGSASNPDNHASQLLDPESMNLALIFSLKAYHPNEISLAKNSNDRQQSGWSFKPFNRNVGIKGFGDVKPILNDMLSAEGLGNLNFNNVQFENREPAGFVAVNLEKNDNVKNVTLFVAFQGTTESYPSIVTDADFSTGGLPFSLEGYAHKGFTNTAMSSYVEVKKAIVDQVSAASDTNFSNLEEIVANQNMRLNIIFCGHSLGAAQATLTAHFIRKELNLPSANTARIQLHIVSLGSPPIFDSTTAHDVNQLFGLQYIRFVAPFDIVPKLSAAGLGFYQHAGQEVSLPRKQYIHTFLFSLLTDYAYSTSSGPAAVATSVAKAGVQMHSCQDYVTTIITDGTYRKFYFGSNDMIDPDAYKYSFGNAMSIWPTVMTSAVLAFLLTRYAYNSYHNLKV
ncbi:MAG: lipase family protein [Candidatus Endonucleobacter sp. (ex Gigantidas childressi)]|nr:lipase family protein [Candidatus Endonucleobacter sp. (ex Gigantidas childressi)]